MLRLALLYAALALSGATPSAWTVRPVAGVPPRACPAALRERDTWLKNTPALALGADRLVSLRKNGERLVDLAPVARTTPIPVRGRFGGSTVACSADGRLAVAWAEEGANELVGVRLALRGADGRLGRGVLLGRGRGIGDFTPGVSGLALAFAPNGGLLVTWVEPFRVRAVTFSPSGRRGETVTLGKASEFGTTVIGFGANGRAVVAWTSHDSGLQVDTSNRVRAVFRSRGGQFGPAQLIHVGHAVDPDDGQPLDLELAVAPDGRALLQWSDITGSYGRGGFKYPIRVAEASPRGRFGRSHQFTRDGEVGAVAYGANGTALAGWYGNGVVRASFHPPGEPFGRSETVPGGGLVEAARPLGQRSLVLTFGDGPMTAAVR